MTCFRRVGSQLVIGVCPQMNENLRVVKRKLYRKVVRRIVLESYPTVHVRGCPMDYFGELSNNSLGGLSNVFIRRVVQRIYSEGCPIKFYRKLNNVFSRTKTFCFEDSVSHNWHMHAWGSQ